MARSGHAGADYLAAGVPDGVDRDVDAGPYTGLAGVAYTLEEAGLASGQPRYQAAARKALGAVMAAAREAGSGVEWNDSTDIVSGSSASGLYLMRASATIGGPAARQLAVRAGRRLLEREHRTGDASLWMMSPGFTRNMPNFSHGTAGVAYFLATLAGETKDRVFAAEGDGLKWVQAENGVSPNVVMAQTGLMQGAADVGLAMLRIDGMLCSRRGTIVLPDSPFA